MPSSSWSSLSSSDRLAPEAGIGAVYRGREVRVVCAAQTAVVLVVVAVWAIVAGPQAEALDDAGIYSGIATAAVAVVGVVRATLRGPGRTDVGSRLLRVACVLYVMLGFALVQIPLAFLVEALGEELIWVVVGSMIGLLVAGVGGSLLVIFVAGGVLGWTEVPPGTGSAGRSAWAILLVATIFMAAALTLGSRVEVRGNRDFVSLVVALLGLDGDVRSATWLWAARVAAVVIALELVVVVRTVRRGRRRAPSADSG